MSLSVDCAISEVGGKLRLVLDVKKSDLKEAMQRAGWKFVDYINDKQLSGRPGLNERSGNMKNSWDVRTSGSKANMVTTITNYCSYIQYHQDGTKTLKKRLKITEKFETVGKRIFRTEIREIVE